MTTPTSEDPFPPALGADQEQPLPFDDAAVFDLTKQVELTQITEELVKALGRQVQVAQMGPDQGWVPSEENPAKLAVSPGSVSKTKVQKVIDDHQPIIGYDIPAREKSFTELTDRLMNDPDAELTDDDIRTAVRALVLREAGRVPGPL